MLCLCLVAQAQTPDNRAVADAGATQPVVAADAEGKLYVAYAAGEPRQVFLKTSTDGKTWSEAEKVTVDAFQVMAGMTRGPRLAVTKDGTIVVTACARLRKDDEVHVYCYRKGPKDKTFAGTRVTTAAAKDHEGMHDMVADAEGDIHVTWLDGREATRGNHLWYARSSHEGKTFKGEVMVYKSPSGSVCPCCAPSIATSANGKTVVIQFRNKLKASGGGPDVHDMYTAVSTDEGKRFATARLDDRERWKG
jgi:hypothetical protein